MLLNKHKPLMIMLLLINILILKMNLDRNNKLKLNQNYLIHFSAQVKISWEYYMPTQSNGTFLLLRVLVPRSKNIQKFRFTKEKENGTQLQKIEQL